MTHKNQVQTSCIVLDIGLTGDFKRGCGAEYVSKQIAQNRWWSDPIKSVGLHTIRPVAHQNRAGTALFSSSFISKCYKIIYIEYIICILIKFFYLIYMSLMKFFKLICAYGIVWTYHYSSSIFPLLCVCVCWKREVCLGDWSWAAASSKSWQEATTFLLRQISTVKFC